LVAASAPTKSRRVAAPLPDGVSTLVILSEASLRAESKDLARHLVPRDLPGVSCEKPVTAAKVAAARFFAALTMTAWAA